MPTHANGSNKTSPQRSYSPLTSADEKLAHNAASLTIEWKNNLRWRGIERPYTAEDVLRLRGSVHIEHTLARLGAERLWQLLQTEPYVNSLARLRATRLSSKCRQG
jgi:isocitrate lyase